MSGNRTFVPLLIFLMALGSYAYFIHYIGIEEWNATSRLNLTYAIADRGTFRIDAYHLNTGDKVYYRGHYYSDKAPGPSFLAVPFYAALKLWFGVRSEKFLHYWLTLLVVGLPSALGAALFYQLLGTWGTARREHRLTVTLGYALGTLACPFATVFYGHQPAAVFALAAGFLCFKVRSGEYPERWSTLWLAGLLSGWSFLCDYPAGIIVALLTLYALVTLKNKAMIIAWAAGLALPVGLLMYYNRSCFGSFLTSSYSYHQTYSHHIGFLGITAPKLGPLWGITFSPYRGIFYQSPFLLLVFPAAYFLFLDKGRRPEWLLCLLIVIAYFSFNAGYAYWDGVGSVGARFLIPCLPFLVFPLIALPPPWRYPLKGLILLSVVFMIVINATEPRAEWRVTSPLFYFNFFLLWNGCLSENLANFFGVWKWPSLIPLALYLVILYGWTRKLITVAEKSDWSMARVRTVAGVVGIVILWLTVAGWEEPHLRRFNQAESLFRYYRGAQKVDWEALEEGYREAIAFEPRFRDPYFRLAEIARFRGKPKLALYYYDELLKIDPQSVVVRQEKALVYDLVGDAGKAEEILREAVNLAPGDVSVRNQLAEFYLQQGRLGEAIEQWEESLKINPRDVRIRQVIEEAKEAFRRIEKGSPATPR